MFYKFFASNRSIFCDIALFQNTLSNFHQYISYFTILQPLNNNRDHIAPQQIEHPASSPILKHYKYRARSPTSISCQNQCFVEAVNLLTQGMHRLTIVKGENITGQKLRIKIQSPH